MTPAEWEEYDRIRALQEARRAEVNAACGFTDAPAQPVVRIKSRKGTLPSPRGHDRWDSM